MNANVLWILNVVTSRSPSPDRADVQDELDAVMLAVQALVAIAARSLSSVAERVTLPQLRVLVLLAGRGTLNLTALAEAMDVNPSSATRACDRLVAAGLVRRTESPTDRRQAVHELTGDGSRLVDTLMRSRRAAIAGVLERIPESRRRGMLLGLQAFGEAAGESLTQETWKLGWPS